MATSTLQLELEPELFRWLESRGGDPAQAALEVLRKAKVSSTRSGRTTAVPAVPLPGVDDSHRTDGSWLLWADGACSGNPGPGGYGVLVRGPEGQREFSRGFRSTTNNRMELRGAIRAIRETPPGSRCVLHTDSRYIVDAFRNRWLESWQRRGWRKADGGEVANIDLWKDLLSLTGRRQVEFRWVQGHSGHVENERCDCLAVAATHASDPAEDLPGEPS